MRANDRVDGPGVSHALILRGVFLLIIFTLSALSAQSRASDAPRRVLILHSFNYTFPATTIISEAVRKRLLERFPQGLEIEADFLDLARHPDATHALRMANFLREKYANVHFDLVLVIGVSGIPFILAVSRRGRTRRPRGIFRRHAATYETLHLPPDVTGVISERLP